MFKKPAKVQIEIESSKSLYISFYFHQEGDHEGAINREDRENSLVEQSILVAIEVNKVNLFRGESIENEIVYNEK